MGVPVTNFYHRTMAKPAEIAPLRSLQRFVARWRLWHVLRQALLALLPALVVFYVLQLWLNTLGALLIALASWAAHWAFQHSRNPYTAITPLKAAALVDREHPAIEHSTELLLARPEELSLPARIQQQRIARELAPILDNQKPPVHIKTLALVAMAVVAAGLLLLRLWHPASSELEELPAANPMITSDSARVQAQAIKRDLPELQEGRIRLAPPTYTGQRARFYELSDVEAPAGSRLTWQLSFRGGVRQVYLTDQKNDTLRFSKTAKGAWVAQLQANTPLFYRIGYATATDTAFSDFMQIRVLPDEPPRVRILKPEQYMLQQEGQPFAVEVEAIDDYGLEDLYLSLTISRGSGENVSFREEKVWLEGFKGARTAKKLLQLNPRHLNMQPGDELYYRLEAFDNKPPRGQHSRSNSWFYQWQDTAAATSMLSSGLAMDIEPEYFRSQRQIIIDTEKLISTQKSTPVARWEKASQNLGVDQKLLRLRYGKFLGEEFESTAGGSPGQTHDHDEHEGEEHEEEEGEDDENVYGNDRHQHDLPGHEEPAGAAPGTGLLELFGHAHDTEEGATFYEESIKVKLKAALAQMWEAEKYLRLSQPKQALPYESRALRIIKEVQQASRVYVERVGLDLPRLIPQEHRLKGEQDKISPQARKLNTTAADSLAASKKLLARLSFWVRGEALGSSDQQLVRQSAKEVAQVLVQGGPHMRYFYLLNSLNGLIESPVPSPEEVQRVQGGLHGLLPRQQPLSKEPLLLSQPQKRFMETVSPSARE